MQSGLNWSAEKFILSPSLSYSDEGDFFAFLTVRFSAGVNPNSGDLKIQSRQFNSGGAVSARVFLDENSNGVFDPGEQPIPNARVQAVHANRYAETDEDGFAFLVGLPQNLLTDVVVQPGSLEDPFWTSAEPGRSIMPRPAVVSHMDFPIVTTAEIEGTVFALRTGDTEPRPMAGIGVSLIDGEGRTVATETSAFDGFYLFTNVLPGIYTIEIDEGDARARRLAKPPPRETEIIPSDETILVVDLLLSPPDPEAVRKDDGQPIAVKLGSYRSVTGASIGWLLLQRRFPRELARLMPLEPLDETRSESFAQGYDLLVGPLTEAEAEAICAQLAELGQFCLVGKPQTKKPEPSS